MYEIKQTDEAIDDVLGAATDQQNKGGSKYPGMSYEDGISDGILWATGQTDNEPPLP